MEENPYIDNMYKRWKDVKEYSDSRINFQSLIDKKDGLDLLTDVSTVVSSVLVNHESRLQNKQDTLIPGKNITIQNNVISSTSEGKTYRPGTNIVIDGDVISANGYYYDENNQSFREGINGSASGSYSHAEGYDTQAYGSASHAEGSSTTASGYASHAEGSSTTASGYRSHAEGSSTTASGYASHAEGNSTTASENYSHAEGYFTRSSGTHSHAEGLATQATHEAEHAEGKYNKSNSIEIPQPIEYVDMGTSVLWAKYNLGATSETEYGDYYAWGETETKETYTGSNYKWTEDGLATVTKYNLTDKKTKLESEDDAAHVNLGGGWRMPTKDEMQELIENCTYSWVTDYQRSGINGYLFTAANSNTLFIPASGYRDTSTHDTNTRCYVWLSTRYSDARYAYYLDFTQNRIPSVDYYMRGYGFTIHPVISPEDLPKVNTIHSTGIGTSNNDRKNAFEIMDNGDVYVKGMGGYDGTNPGVTGVLTLQETFADLKQQFDDFDTSVAARIYAIMGVTGINN